MDNDYYLQVEKLLHQAAADPNPYTAMAQIEKAIAIAEGQKDALLQLEVRSQLMFTAFRHGFHDRSLAVFPWMLGYVRDNPEEINPQAVIVMYITALNGITEFPDISRQQITGVIEQMLEYYQQHGYSLREAYRVARHTMLEMGDTETAEQYRQQQEQATPGMAVHDCHACDLFAEVTYLDHLGRHQQAIATAQPLIRGEELCQFQQQAPWAALLVSLITAGNLTGAVDCYQKSMQKQHLQGMYHLWYVYRYLAFYALTLNLEKGLKMMEQTFKVSLGRHAPALDYLYWLACELLLQQLRQRGDQAVVLRLPRNFECFEPDGEYQVANLLQWLDRQITDLEGRFNQRNGNTFFSDLKVRHRQLGRYATSTKLELGEG